MAQEVNITDIRVERTTPVDPGDVAATAADIKANGQQVPLIIDRWGLLIDGLIRLRALQLLGAQKVKVDVARTLQEGLDLINSRSLKMRELSMRRRRDFGENLTPLIDQQIAHNFRMRYTEGRLVKNQTRELVATALGYPWHRIRRVYRWLEEDPQDQHRRELLQALEDGHTSVNQIYMQIGRMKIGPLARPKVSPAKNGPFTGGDITAMRDQLHLLEELNRQLSAAMKGAAKLGAPLIVPSEKLNTLLAELVGHRTELNAFIKALRNGSYEQ